MDDKTVQQKLDKIAKLARELDGEAKLRWGREAQLFLEPESGLFLMSHDRNDERADIRQEGILFQAQGECPIAAGGW